MNKLSVRKKFYTATKKEDETVLQFANRIDKLAESMKSMAIDVPEYEQSMAFLNGLPQEYHALISALDTLAEDGTQLKWDLVKSRV